MREIKFRIWDKFQKKFIYKWQEAIAGHINTFNTNVNPNNIYALQDELLVFQQFTGLKDVNGVEIYEGDIVEGISNNTFSLGEVDRYEIIWGIDHWHVRGTYYSLQELFNYCNNQIRVISNIYELKK